MMAQNIVRLNTEIDILDLLGKIDLRTLILHRTDDAWIDVAHSRYMGGNIPGASYVELPGTDHRPWLGDVDAIVDEVEIFLTGRKGRPRRREQIGMGALSRREGEVALLPPTALEEDDNRLSHRGDRVRPPVGPRGHPDSDRG